MAPPPAMPVAEAIAPVPASRDSKINRDLLAVMGRPATARQISAMTELDICRTGNLCRDQASNEEHRNCCNSQNRPGRVMCFHGIGGHGFLLIRRWGADDTS